MVLNKKNNVFISIGLGVLFTFVFKNDYERFFQNEITMGIYGLNIVLFLLLGMVMKLPSDGEGRVLKNIGYMTFVLTMLHQILLMKGFITQGNTIIKKEVFQDLYHTKKYVFTHFFFVILFSIVSFFVILFLEFFGVDVLRLLGITFSSNQEEEKEKEEVKSTDVATDKLQILPLNELTQDIQHTNQMVQVIMKVSEQTDMEALHTLQSMVEKINETINLYGKLSEEAKREMLPQLTDMIVTAGTYAEQVNMRNDQCIKQEIQAKHLFVKNKAND